VAAAAAALVACTAAASPTVTPAAGTTLTNFTLIDGTDPARQKAVASLMVEAGFTPRQALRAATRQATEFLKASDLGTLQTGKWADLVVLEADPYADILNTRKIRTVYLAGKEVVAVTKK
jgi:imidazolonepropionase-like amidohydrolase